MQVGIEFQKRFVPRRMTWQKRRGAINPARAISRTHAGVRASKGEPATKVDFIFLCLKFD
jgi:hypothetical protein